MLGLKNMFNANKILENQKLENEILAKQLYEEKVPLISVEIVQEYLHHFSSFKFDHKKTKDLIVDLSTKYNFDNKYVSYFLAQLNSNLYSIKNQNLSGEDSVKELDYQQEHGIGERDKTQGTLITDESEIVIVGNSPIKKNRREIKKIFKELGY